MKTWIVALLASATFAAGAFAQEQQEEKSLPEPQRVETRTIAPVCFSLQGDDTIDIIGLRLGVLGSCQTLTGVDLSICGEAVNAYGLQLALFRNNVIDRAGALQIAVGANHATHLAGAQIAFWNDSVMMRGLQVGLVNTASDVRGLQIGLINNTDMIYGYQIGLINVIKGSFVPFFPIVNTMLSAD